ncbi:hypothetical protein SAMN04488587_1611 [Methanococcoides vulcani]|uniref:DUF2110 family protein n=1 Tax=Methanococcoides vulcani TaxID=1353158 RepID=A0A1I0AEN1_9EURY|nr:DUF2110 family protein [Methanococcoides vulcani]SES92579.1 hypothetical protein SAMN04488587_1611 [Methanococcoides vulcani]
METAILTIKLYANLERALSSAAFMLENELKDIDATVEVSVNSEGWLQANVSGEDEVFAANFLIDKYGTPVTKVENTIVYKGSISSIDDEGITVDVGVTVKLLPEALKALGVGTVSQIASRFGLIPHLPVSVRIEGQDGVVTGRFTKDQLDLFWGWKKAATDRLIVNSVTRSELKSAIKKKGHGRDIYGIERIGLLENIVVCREKTDGPGIVAEIGPLVKADIGVIRGTH